MLKTRRQSVSNVTPQVRVALRHVEALFLALLAVLGARSYDIPITSEGLPCAKSGKDFCSLGKVKPWTGDVRTSAALKACLAARSYNKELILLTETRLNPAYQTFAQLVSLGYEHVVLLSLEAPCAASQAVWPRLACAWSSQSFTSTTKYLLDRVVFLARASRLGTNVLMLDSDVIPQADLYSHLKAPDMGNVTLAAMRDGNGWLNCGVVYAQNVAPDGPTAYVLAEIVDRLERWAEGATHLSSRGNPAHCWDQQMYSDTLLSALAGRPISYGCWYRHEGARRAAWEVAHQRVFGTQETGPLENQHYLQGALLSWPAELAAPGYPHKKSEIWTGEMHVPNARGEWPAELGGPLYPPQRGPSSTAFMELIKSDGLPLWPDPEDPKQAEAGAAKMEIFSFLPQWLAESWSSGGGLGYWYPGLRGDRPAVALAHMVHVPGGPSNKLTVKAASGNWDWDVAHAASRAPPEQGGSGPFFASKTAAPLPDVLAYSGEIENRAWASEDEFAAATLALLRLAMEVGRAAAFPALRCNLTWMITGPVTDNSGTHNDRLPLAVNQAYMIPYTPPGRGFSDLRCLWGGYLPLGCQAVRWYFSGGMLATEYDHLLELLRLEGEQAVAAALAAGQHNPAVATAARTAKLARWGFATGAGAGSLRDTLRNTTGSSARVVTVPKEMLQPPAGAAAWEVKDLAAKLMAAYGGIGSSLLRSPAAALAAMRAGNTSSTGSGSAAGSGSSSGERPLVLVLPEVPKLTQTLGERHAIFKKNLETGDDRNRYSCEWVRTGKPYRRRGRRMAAALRRSSSRRRGR
ncbi:hypothetical protein HYH02_002750 [Chlamydomonas schloesseri]|uniref:Nucleotide-diphospho-sugar transferase domain-containing protein n=1 Tax=Chlamydomonas schloesseri TaxID=2026947 RepID=A0A836BAB1_9CHLO|nr:hypothetical protein HYH02_002750 [Chlamydomonas schloesseri]|eukprot:KAG2452511.1 hypothetical protein HYH02_002750 [Chlamydomonas schloesseri]